MHSSPSPALHSDALNSEGQLESRIRERLQQQGGVDATKIGVVIREDGILLWGSVATEHERATAGEVAAAVAGRLSVLNQVHVYRTPG